MNTPISAGLRAALIGYCIELCYLEAVGSWTLLGGRDGAPERWRALVRFAGPKDGTEPRGHDEGATPDAAVRGALRRLALECRRAASAQRDRASHGRLNDTDRALVTSWAARHDHEAAAASACSAVVP